MCWASDVLSVGMALTVGCSPRYTIELGIETRAECTWYVRRKMVRTWKDGFLFSGINLLAFVHIYLSVPREQLYITGLL